MGYYKGYYRGDYKAYYILRRTSENKVLGFRVYTFDLSSSFQKGFHYPLDASGVNGCRVP